ncbi:MAG: hypothetical protein C0478_01610 [Planctomyces sp.]|nr:hypothetical protein [Planctomyces sp.]
MPLIDSSTSCGPNSPRSTEGGIHQRAWISSTAQQWQTESALSVAGMNPSPRKLAMPLPQFAFPKTLLVAVILAGLAMTGSPQVLATEPPPVAKPATTYASSASAQPILRANDRVVWIGPTWVERDVNYGQVETELLTRMGSQPFTLRNLGWSGDTVWAESRGIFDAPAVGYSRLIELAKELKPTTVWLSYGVNESWAGAAGLPKFTAQYRQLANDITKATGARLVFITPYPFEKTVSPVRDPSGQNVMLGQYVAAIKQLAAELNAPVIDLFTPLAAGESLKAENGLHPDAIGEQIIARRLANQFRYAAEDGSAAVSVTVPEPDREELRQAVVAKNTLFFHRWRPQNITYLTGFRKHEQGNNAVEIAQFDPLVDAAEKSIQQWLSARSEVKPTPGKP